MKRLLPILMGFALLLLSSTEGWSSDYQKGLDAALRGDFETALREWKPLAEQGNAAAQHDLGRMYYVGDGVLQDYKTAAEWYALAAMQLAPGSTSNGRILAWGAPTRLGEAAFTRPIGTKTGCVASFN
jgi:TPR repeat protein